ncbi:MAG: dipicolinate synthase subunit DpsA [Firmicutes bacterium]|nr:dipicolinate synthase subunit DpsA [Bacillota bacterium]HPU00690.1 dipicolinate synthase subunit DpsA [Bacillota bacterium]
MPEEREKIIICGGDRREMELYRRWKEEGLDVKLAGFEQASYIDRDAMAREEDFARAAVLIAPLTGVKADGTVKAIFSAGSFSFLSCLAKAGPDVILLAGSVASPLKEELAAGYRLVLTAADEELALLNAIPTAEGAIQKAMELSPITLHGSVALVIGLGRCGTVLARALQGLGAHVRVLVRRCESAALAFAAGYTPYDMASAAEALSGADFIFNTAPALVLDAARLQLVKKDALILDLASEPGGTDFAAAKALGLTAMLLPGLPGQAAPRTAGAILARVYRRLIAQAKQARRSQ